MKHKISLIVKFRKLTRLILLRLLMTKPQWDTYLDWATSDESEGNLGHRITLYYTRESAKPVTTHYDFLYEQATSSACYPVKNYKFKFNEDKGSKDSSDCHALKINELQLGDDISMYPEDSYPDLPDSITVEDVEIDMAHADHYS